MVPGKNNLECFDTIDYYFIYCYHKITNVILRKQFFLAMTETTEDEFFYPETNENSETMVDPIAETDSGKKTQIGIRLDADGSRMLASIRNWFSRQKSVEFLGEEGTGPAIATTDTTLARFILDAGIKALYSDVQNDELIDEVAKLFKKHSVGRVCKLLNDKYGLPDDLEKKILALGFKRSQQIARSEEFSNVKTQAQRLETKYGDQLSGAEEELEELYQHEGI